MNVIAGAASLDNIQKSIINPIKLDDIKKYFTDNTINKLQILYPDGKIFMWALSNAKNYKNKFNIINNGDILLLKENGQRGRIFFNYSGKVIYKLELNNNIGNILWRNPKWTRLMFIHNIKYIKIEDKIVSTIIGYKDNFDYPFTAVQPLQDNKTKELLDIIDNDGYVLDKFNDIKIDSYNEKLILDNKLSKIIKNIGLLKRNGNHSERDNEALVKDFLEYCGYIFVEDFNYRIGFIDIGILKNNKCVCVIEVKKEWDENKLIQQAQKQSFGYALENGARYVIITNGDTYILYDRNKAGLTYDDYIVVKFKLSSLNNYEDLDKVYTLFKANML